MKVDVRDNNVEQALRVLKKRMQREGVFREMRLREHFEKPSVKRAREKPKASGALGKWPAKSWSVKAGSLLLRRRTLPRADLHLAAGDRPSW